MNKRKLALITAIIFLVQLTPVCSLLAENNLLNIPTNIQIKDSNILFREVWGILSLAISMYKTDTRENPVKYEMAELCAKSNLYTRFDLINMGEKGWAKYYPFLCGDKVFTIKIFPSEWRRRYQEEEGVLFEGEIENPAVMFQILPGISAMLKDCRIEPHAIYSGKEAAVCP